MHTAYAVITGQLRASPAGLYALQPMTAQSDDTRLLPITGQTLGSATHELALAAKAVRGATPFERETDLVVPQMQSRLRLLGQCLNECTNVPRRSSSPQQTLREVSWGVYGITVRPPVAIARCLRRYPELSTPTAGQAVMEFALRSGSADLDHFARTLRELIVECQWVDEEPQRRRGILFSLLKDAMQTQPAYLPIFYSSLLRGTLTTWKVNRAFAREVVNLFFRDYVPPFISDHLSKEAKWDYSFQDVCSWLVGIELAPFKGGPFSDTPNPPDIILRLTQELGPLPPTTAEMERSEFIEIAARCAVLTGDADVPRRFAAWLRTCRQFAPLAKNRGGIWGCANPRRWITASNLDAAHLRRLSELLAARGIELFNYGWVRHRSPTAAFWSLARLGAIPHEDALRIVDLDLIDMADEFFAGKPRQLTAFVRFVQRHHHHWSEIETWQRRWWVRLFSGLQSERLCTRLSAWIERLFSHRRFKFQDAAHFIPEVVNFLADEPGSERPSREAFVLEHISLFDRILDEIEATLFGLPRQGFDEWRSHAHLWRLRFGICEILYQWESARFSDGAALVDEAFAWCRKREAADIARRAPEPWNHFNNVYGNEALAVRLSGGVSRRLLQLLEYYIERWNKPDHPMDGWRFLDRFPEIQQALQELCRDPSALRFVVRTLRRLALGLRLQRRAFLLTRLKEWTDACSPAEPLERLRAFGRVAGYSTTLPSTVQHLFDREQSLRRERDTLQTMHAEGRASSSALRRLAKLDQLLLDPSAIAGWVEKDVRRVVTKMLPWVRANVFALITREAVRHHWKGMVDGGGNVKGRDWDNALHFYYSADRNKEVLRKLLRHTAQSDPGWRLQHPPNAKFLADLRAHGFDADAWLAPYSTPAEVHGETWTVKLQQNPLRILQMGNLFGTCLSVDDCNAFAAIANAVEVNKQVLFLEDADGRVVGRKLIGLTSAGHLFGFRSYGASCLHEIGKPEKPEVWIKILFDLACLDIIRRVKGQFDDSADLETAADQLRLAADWYNDGPETFDWWITQPDLAEHVHRGTRAPVAAAILQHLEQYGLDNDATQTLRALLWLGDDAGTIVERFGPSFFAPKYVRYLRGQSPSENVRALLTEEGASTTPHN